MKWRTHSIEVGIIRSDDASVEALTEIRRPIIEDGCILESEYPPLVRLIHGKTAGVECSTDCDGG